MKPISVEKAGLVDDFAAWGVAPNYARFFLAKCREENGLIMLEPFVFNDSIHITNRHQWFVANVVFWYRAYTLPTLGKPSPPRAGFFTSVVSCAYAPL